MPAYVVSRVQIRDAEAMRRYVTEAPATVAAFGGSYHFRGSNVEALEGTWEHDRLVVLEVGLWAIHALFECDSANCVHACEYVDSDIC